VTSILTVCVVLSLGQAGTSPEISEFLRQSPEAQFLAEVVSDFPIGGCARLNRVALDLVLPSLGWRPDLDRCGQVKIITEEDLVGLVLKPETLESLIPEGAAENELREMLARLGTEKARQFRIDVAFLPPLALEAAGGNDAPQLAEELDPANSKRSWQPLATPCTASRSWPRTSSSYMPPRGANARRTLGTRSIRQDFLRFRTQ
jgi:hypothetical protein